MDGLMDSLMYGPAGPAAAGPVFESRISPAAHWPKLPLQCMGD